MSEEPKIILLQVLLPPEMKLEQFEQDELAERLLHTTQGYLSTKARVIFFTHGSEVHRLEED